MMMLPILMTFVVLKPNVGEHDNEKLRYSPLPRHAAIPPPLAAPEIVVAEEPTPEPTLVPSPVVAYVPPPAPRIQPAPQPLRVVAQTTERNWESFAAKMPRVTACESHGNYSTNTGNGYYGAWQFDLQTWRSVGGTGLPSNASAQEQNERAYMLYLSRGWAPWPACGLK